MVTTVSDFVNFYFRPFTVSVVLLFGVPASGQSNGIFVPVSGSRPEPVSLPVVSGGVSHLDLLLATALPVENECRTSLFAVAGPSTMKLSEKTGRLPVAAEGKAGSRTPLVITIPTAAAGAKFVLRVECLAPTRRLLGTVQLQIPEFDPVDKLRHELSTREVAIVGDGQRLRALFSKWQIPFKDQPADPAINAVVLVESGDGPGDSLRPHSPLQIEISFHSGSTLAVTGRPNGDGWIVEAELPHSAKFSDIESAEYLSEVFRFINKLEKPSIPQ
jgi:hypothetical protein